MTFVWVQKAADGSVRKLWHQWTYPKCAISRTMKSQGSIRNYKVQYDAKQDLILISKKISYDILVI